MTTPSLQAQRDNLTVGLFLAQNPHGVGLDQILINTLGYDPRGTYPMNSIERYERRFREAQRVGRDQFRDRVPGYFTFNAMPFGSIYVYKVTWYTWVNPQTRNCQAVPLVSTDLAPMRRLRDQDLSTREATTRSVRAAHDIEEEQQALARRDPIALQAIQNRMLEDGSLGEILTGFHGIPYADLAQVLPQLPTRSFGNMTLQFQRMARSIARQQRRLRQEEAQVSRQLLNWVMVQTGLPNNAPRLALQDATARLNAMGGPVGP